MNQRLILYSDAVNRHELSCFEETVIISFFVGSNLRLKPRDVRAMVLNRDGFMSRSPSPDWDVANAWTLIETLSMQSGSFVAGTKSKQKKNVQSKDFSKKKKVFTLRRRMLIDRTFVMPKFTFIFSESPESAGERRNKDTRKTRRWNLSLAGSHWFRSTTPLNYWQPPS